MFKKSLPAAISLKNNFLKKWSPNILIIFPENVFDYWESLLILFSKPVKNALQNLLNFSPNLSFLKPVFFLKIETGDSISFKNPILISYLVL